jgi:hypothetical protein
MKYSTMTDNQKRIMVAMLDGRFNLRTTMGLAGAAECDASEVEAFMEANPQVFKKISTNSGDAWGLRGEVCAENLLAMRVRLFHDLDWYPVEVRPARRESRCACGGNCGDATSSGNEETAENNLEFGPNLDGDTN